jgi:hypothetical protein
MRESFASYRKLCDSDRQILVGFSFSFLHVSRWGAIVRLQIKVSKWSRYYWRSTVHFSSVLLLLRNCCSITSRFLFFLSADYSCLYFSVRGNNIHVTKR